MVSIRGVKAVAVAVAVAAAMLAAGPRASAGTSPVPVVGEVSPYAVMYQSPGGVLKGEADGSEAFNTGEPMAPGTSPAASETPQGYQVVWQGANNMLWSIDGASPPGEPGDLGMEPGTSPGLVTFPDGKWAAVVAGLGGNLTVTGSWGSNNYGAQLDPGTSPSVAAVTALTTAGPIPDAFMIAYQSEGRLWVQLPPSAPVDVGPMAAGTSPSIASAQTAPVPGLYGGNYTVAYQGTNGDLWTENGGAPGRDTGYPMAPGASPSISLVNNPPGTYNSGEAFTEIAYRGSNGDLWEDPVDGVVQLYGSQDAGVAVMAGTNPVIMSAPVDEPGAPLGGTDTYTAYMTAVDAVALYGIDYTDGTNFIETTGMTAATGTSPGPVSLINLAGSGSSAAAAPDAARAPARAARAPARVTAADGRTAVPLRLPLKLPSRAATGTMSAQPVIADTCPTVRAHMKQYAARGIKEVTCEIVIRGTPPGLTRTRTTSPARAGSRAAAPDATGVPALCANTSNMWQIARFEECIQSETLVLDIVPVDDPTVVTGTQTFVLNQDILLQNNSTKYYENDSVTFTNPTGTAPDVADTTFTSACTSPCKVTSGGQISAVLGVNGTANGQTYYQDNPAGQTPDLFTNNYTLSVSLPAIITGKPASWSPPQGFRCDNMFSGNMGAGCVVQGPIPVLDLPVGQYGAAAMNVWIGETSLPGHPGLSPTSPLTRGDPNLTGGNQARVCRGFKYLPAVPNDSCDEYPFASTQQSGGQIKGLIARNCLEVQYSQNPNGTWGWKFLNKYTYNVSQMCLRGHVPSAQNSAVGSALIAFYTANRMLIGDPFVVEVTQ